MKRSNGNNRGANLVALPARKTQAVVRNIAERKPEIEAGGVNSEARAPRRFNGGAAAKKEEQIKLLKDMCAALTSAVEILERPSGAALDGSLDLDRGVSFYEEVRRFETNLIRRALQHTGGRQTKAAALLGINHTTLHAMIKRYKIKTNYS